MNTSSERTPEMRFGRRRDYALVLLLLACLTLTPLTAEEVQDPSSYANVNDVRVTHMDLDLAVDFDRRVLSGSATLQIDNMTGADTLILDVWDLDIRKIHTDAQEEAISFSLGEKVEYKGTPLRIPVSDETEQVTVHYTTSPGARALQWVQPSETAGQSSPFLYTQSQFIMARSWIPCQDTPEIRMTYTATIRTEPEYLALMSARNPQEKDAKGVYQFEMPQPIPSYLMALAVGDLEFREIGDESGVYAEPAVVEDAAWEFTETAEMIQAAEDLYGPYLWGRYDLLVLPPSFPFGGMENPRLTFVTPTIIAGDRSLVSLVAHELAHSWSGNLVTNATWEDFWLNEGFTMYFEHRIIEEIKGRAFAEMENELNYRELQRVLDRMGRENPDTRLKTNLEERDPEKAFSLIPYFKGLFFLEMLENHFGRKRWDVFLERYFDRFQFQSVTTGEFLEYLRSNLLNEKGGLEEKLRIREWIYEPGLPENCPAPDSEELELVAGTIERWQGGRPAEKLKTGEWTTQHWLYFLQNLPDTLSAEEMQELDTAFQFTETGNMPILKEWLVLSVNSGYREAFSRMESFLTRVGRISLIEPVYRALAKSESGFERAKHIFEQARSGYHAMTVQAISDLLEDRQ